MCFSLPSPGYRIKSGISICGEIPASQISLGKTMPGRLVKYYFDAKDKSIPSKIM